MQWRVRWALCVSPGHVRSLHDRTPRHLGRLRPRRRLGVIASHVATGRIVGVLATVADLQHTQCTASSEERAQVQWARAGTV